MVSFRPSWLLRFHLPSSLRSRPATVLPRYYEASDFSQMLSTHLRDLRSSLQRCLLVHSISNHHMHPWTSRSTVPCRSPGGPLAQTSPLSRRLVNAYGRIEFLIVRTGLSPPLLSTPSHDDAVNCGYRSEQFRPGRDFHPPDNVRSSAHKIAAFRGTLRNAG